MPGYNLEVQVSYQPQIAIIRMEGEINGSAEDVLHWVYLETEAGNCDYILLNFTRVKYKTAPELPWWLTCSQKPGAPIRKC